MTVLSRVDPLSKAPATTRPGPRHHAGRLRVVVWDDTPDPIVGADPRSMYAETFWLPLLGPAAMALLRLLVDRLASCPDGFVLELDEALQRLGLGVARAPLRRAMLRCVRFGAARQPAPDVLAVRRTLPRLPRHVVGRLPFLLQREHAQWEQDQRSPTVVDIRRRARLVALDRVEVAESLGWLERQVMHSGVHPAMAAEAAAWAWERAPRPSRSEVVESDP